MMKNPNKNARKSIARKTTARKPSTRNASRDTSSQKTQRWIDLLVALFRHRFPATFIELAKDVPGYRSEGKFKEEQPSESLKRMFERDKKELLRLGIPLESMSDAGKEEYRYRLRPADFYLPYLGIVTSRGVQNPARVHKDGYLSLRSLMFEPDELEAIADGGRHVAQAGDPSLTEDAGNALRKLAFDLPLDATGINSGEILVPPRPRADPAMLATLGDALFRRKRVTFHYESAGADPLIKRTVEPYGLFFLNGHWYLVGRDATKNGLRNFRVSRMSGVLGNRAKPGSADYEIPATFSLREHARSRQAWEIGDGDAFEAVVEFRGDTGAAMAAAALGKPDPDSSSSRRFHVRRTDSFARWLLTFADEARPVTPAALVEEYAKSSGRRAHFTES